MNLYTFTQSARPISLVLFGDNVVGWTLIDILLEQESKVILVGGLTKSNQKRIKALHKRADFLFLDRHSILKHQDSLKRLDYCYVFLHHLISGSKTLSSKDLVQTSNELDIVLKLAVEFVAKTVVSTSAIIPQLLEPLPNNNWQLQLHAEKLVKEYADRTDLPARIVRIAELLGDKFDQTYPTFLKDLLSQLQQHNDFTIYGDGLTPNYFVHYRDAVLGILNAAFTGSTAGKIITLSNEGSVSTLNLVYHLLELIPEERNVVFKDSKFNNQTQYELLSFLDEVKDFSWQPRIKFAQALRDTTKIVIGDKMKLIEFPEQNETSSVPDNLRMGSKTILVKSDPKWAFVYNVFNGFIGKPFTFVYQGIAGLRPKSIFELIRWSVTGLFRNTLLVLVMLFLLGVFYWILSPFIIIAWQVKGINTLINNSKTNIISFEVNNLEQNLTELEQRVNIIYDKYHRISWLKTILPESWKRLVIETGDILESEKIFLESVHLLFTGAKPHLQYLKEFQFDTKINDPINNPNRGYSQYITQMQDNQLYLAQSVGPAEETYQKLLNVDQSVLPTTMQTYLQKQIDLMPNYIKGVRAITDLNPQLPYLLGYDRRVNYFLVLQNPTEIRSLGGWFTTLAIIGMENGQIKEFTLNDVYNVDGRIKGIPASTEMQKALDISRFKLSLSNWQPLLPKAMQDIQQVYKQFDAGTELNIVVATNLNVVNDLLAKYGSVNTSYGQVDSTTMYDLVTRVHKDFSPGSQNKKDVVSDITRQLLPIVFDKGNIVPSSKVLGQALLQNDILLWSDNLKINDLLAEYATVVDWSRNSDIIYPVDWNAGGNKADLQISRKVEIMQKAGSNKDISLSFTYNNSSTSDNYPEGEYRDYFRLYLPAQSKIKRINGLEAQVSTQYGFTKVSGWVKVPIKSYKSFTIVITLPSNRNIDELLFIKQPGVKDVLIFNTIEGLTEIPNGFTRSIGNQVQKGFVLKQNTKLKVF